MQIEEISLTNINEFWNAHIKYLIEDEIISDEEDISYFSGRNYRGVMEEHMIRNQDKQHMAYFSRNGDRIGAVSYCTY